MNQNDILDVIHKTIYQFFDVCKDDEGIPMSDKDKLLLEVNKAICNNIKTLEQEPKTGHWMAKEVRGSIEPYCSICNDSIDTIYHYNYCPNCGAKMDRATGRK